METEGRTKYRVFKANIMDDDGNKVMAGEIVELSSALARRYNKLGFLRPYLDDEGDEEDAEPAGSVREPVKPTRPRIRRTVNTEANSL